MAHGVGPVVRDELLLAVVIEVVSPFDGWPPGLSAPVTVIEEPSGPGLGDGGEHHGIPVEPVYVTFKCFQDMGRERDLPATPGALGILLAAPLGVDLDHEEARAALVDAVTVKAGELAPAQSGVDAK